MSLLNFPLYQKYKRYFCYIHKLHIDFVITELINRFPLFPKIRHFKIKNNQQ